MDTLTPGLLSLLNGHPAVDDSYGAICLATVDEDSSPRIALLSTGEVLARSPSEIRIAVWSTSATSENLFSGRPALLLAVDDGAAWHIRGRPAALGAVVVGTQRMNAYRLTVSEVTEDRLGYARVGSDSPLRFIVADPQELHQRWLVTIDALRKF